MWDRAMVVVRFFKCGRRTVPLIKTSSTIMVRLADKLTKKEELSEKMVRLTEKRTNKRGARRENGMISKKIYH